MADNYKSKSQLIAELQELRQRLTTRQDAELIQQILFNISKATSETKTLKELLEIIHYEVGKLIDATNFFVALYDNVTDHYTFPYYVDQYDSGHDFTQEQMRKSLTEYVRKRRTPLLIDDTTDKKLIKKGEVNLVGHSSLIWMGVPFTINERISGVVVSQSYSKRSSYTKRDLEVMTFVSEHIAWAIERKQSEQDLSESEERYRRLVDNSPICIAIHNKGKIQFLNNAAVTLLGGKEYKDFINKPINNFIHTDFRKFVNERIDKLKKDKYLPLVEEKFIRLDGSIVDVQVMSTTCSFNGRVAVQSVFTDISERKKAEQALKTSEESYKGLFDNARDAIYILDSDGVFLNVNKTAVKMYGYNRNYFIGKTPEFLSAPGLNDLEKVQKSIVLAFKGKPQTFFFWGLRKNGDVFPKEVRLSASSYFGKNVILAYAIDITERKKAEKALQESEHRFRTLIEKSPVAISIGRKGHIIFANNTYLEMFGFKDEKEVKGQKIITHIESHERKKISQYLKLHEQGKKVSATIESIGLRKDGSIFPFHASTSIISLIKGPATLVYLSDISDLKKTEKDRLDLERQILQTQKLESLGVLAGGIAHDFNNLLTGIMGNTGLAMMHSEENSNVKTNLENIEQIASRAAELCNQMLAYSGKGKFVIQPIDINDVVRDMALLLNVSIPKKVSLQLILDAQIPAIEADIAQIRQVIMNLITNAADALGNKSGIIQVKTICKSFKKEELYTSYMEDELKDGKYVMCEVKDSGSGMSEDTMHKLFDPFYTTKFTGRGLGLAAVLGIVRGHKGSIKIKSKLNEGTQIRVFFPATLKKAMPIAKKIKSMSLPKASGTILVVDDEESVRSIVKEALEYSGFKIMLAKDGAEAVQLYKKQQAEINLVLLDMTMPRLNGEETYYILKRINPKIKVVLSSGFNAHDAIKKFTGNGLAGYLQKPYHLQTLRDKMYEILSPQKEPKKKLKE